MRRLLLALCLSVAPLLIAQSAPDLIIFNAKVFTADPANPSAQAVAISGDHIAAVGTNDQVKSMAGDATKRIDAKGRVVIPGINDALIEQCATSALGTSLNADSSGEDVLAAVAGAADESPAEQWISGTIGMKALNDAALTAAALDKISQGHRVILFSATGDAVAANSTAFSALRVNDTDPAGGSWLRDANGRWTGKGVEYAARNMLRRWAEQTSDDDLTDSLTGSMKGLTELGVTTAQVSPCLPYKRLERLLRRVALPLRVRIINTPLTNSGGRNTDELRDMPAAGARSMVAVSGARWNLGTSKPNFSNEEIAAILKEGGDYFSGDAHALVDALKTAPPHRVAIDAAITPDMIATLKEHGTVVVHRGAMSKNDALASIVKSGVPVAIAANGAPWSAFELAISDSKDGLTRDQALAAMTRGPAFVENAENDKGILAIGKVADLAVLSQDVLTGPVSSLSETRSVLTIVGGKIVYDSHAIH